MSSVPAAGEPEPQTLDEILDWHQGVVEALAEQRAAALRAAREGTSVASRFVGMTDDDLEAYYDFQRRELDRLTVLNLVASAEAWIRDDYSHRVRNKLKNPLARAYRKWHKTLSRRKKRRPDFDENGILDVVKKAGVMNNHLIGQYRECLRARHWVGHGRHWPKPREADFLPELVHARCLALLQAWPD